MGGIFSMYLGEEGCVQILVGEPEEKRELRRLKHRW
jgi:hypothetical protein